MKVLLVGALLMTGYMAHAQEYVEGEVIVKFKANKAGDSKFANKAVGLGMNLKRSWDKLNVHQYQSKAGHTQSVEQLVQQLKADPNVEIAEPNYIYRAQSIGTSGPVISLEQFRAQKAEAVKSVQSKAGVSAMSVPSYSQSGADIKADEAWAVMTSSMAHIPVVAIIDSGVDYTHDVFVDSGAIWTNPGETPNDNIDNDNNGYIDDVRGWNFYADNNNPMDDNNHGTHVAGIVLGATQDITAATLQPAKIRIMPLKFLSSSGSGSTSDGIEAIYYAINNGATVINASWGGGGYSQTLLAAITAAYNAQVSFVAAAGNSHLNNDSQPTYPANYSVQNIISIAATTDYDSMASFSNYGKQTVHIASPGEDIWSTLPNNGWAEFSGTSMATPLVSGIVALMEREAGVAINGYQARQILLGENDAGVGNVTGKVVSDSRVNIYKAVSYVQANGVDDYQPVARDVASADSDSGGGGCGLIKKTMESSGEGGGDLFGRALLMLIVLTPFVVALVLKQKRKEIENRREHARYNISSEVRMSFGEKELVGAVSSISMGGVKIDSEALMENGSIIEMNIMSPDGKEKIQVMGKVVWSAERKSYGVAFCDMAAPQSSAIQAWTKKLVKAS
jgi:hypothetical protein